MALFQNLYKHFFYIDLDQSACLNTTLKILTESLEVYDVTKIFKKAWKC